MNYGMPRADQVDQELLAERMEAAWRDFVAAADEKYPAATWPPDRIRATREQLQNTEAGEQQLGGEAEREGRSADASAHYQSAADLNVEAVVLGAVLAERGDPSMERSADEIANAMARVICGAGPERRIVTTRGPDGHEVDAVLLDEESDRGFQALWERAGVHAAPHRIAEPLPAAWINGPDGLTRAIAEDLARTNTESTVDVPTSTHDRGVDFER